MGLLGKRKKKAEPEELEAGVIVTEDAPKGVKGEAKAGLSDAEKQYVEEVDRVASLSQAQKDVELNNVLFAILGEVRKLRESVEKEE